VLAAFRNGVYVSGADLEQPTTCHRVNIVFSRSWITHWAFQGMPGMGPPLKNMCSQLDMLKHVEQQGIKRWVLWGMVCLNYHPTIPPFEAWMEACVFVGRT
jgi:hypothetical protein